LKEIEAPARCAHEILINLTATTLILLPPLALATLVR
jgi:hypothetical protein